MSLAQEPDGHKPQAPGKSPPLVLSDAVARPATEAPEGLGAAASQRVEPTEQAARNLALPRPADKQPPRKSAGLYVTSLVTRKVSLNIRFVGQHLKANLEENLRASLEGQCVVEGFVRPGSTRLVTYSSGLIKAESVQFSTVVECQVCNPVEGMLIGCVVKNVTKAGIRAELGTVPSPIVVFIARDHNHMNPHFNSITEGAEIKARVLGQRFELRDKFISVIAELVEEKSRHKQGPRAKLVIPGNQ